MLSILIPTYNYNASELVKSMLALAHTENVDAEVIVGDDGSTRETAWMDELCTPEPVGVPVRTLKGSRPNPYGLEPEPLRVLRAPQNIGRSAIRNRLAEAARGEWLLFVDCDARMSPDFSLRRYLAATEHSAVVSGGLCNPSEKPVPGCELRWYYERAAEPLFAAERLNRMENIPFRTFSFIIRRDLFLSVRFDETIRNYGYEDVLFGIELERIGHKPYYIDNPLINGDIESNAVYLAKAEEAMRTLQSIPGGLHGHSLVENTALRMRRLHLDGLIVLLYRILRKRLRKNLLGSHPNLRFFAFYKLGYLLSIRNPRP